MKRKISTLNKVLVVLLAGLCSCTASKKETVSTVAPDSTIVQTNKVELAEIKKPCEIDSILANSDYLFSNQDTITILKRGQSIYPLDMEVRKFLKNERYGNYFYVSSYDILNNVSMFTYFDDDVPIPAVYLATIKDCKLVSNIQVGKASGWENGNTFMKSIIHEDKTIETITYSESKDWGDYTVWDYDTTIIKYKINDNGLIEKLNN